MEYHILVADDEPEIRSLVREWLTEDAPKKLRGNYIVYEAANGADALTKSAECKASGHSLDLAIIDLMMPGTNGFETIDDLLKSSPPPAIVVFSATTDFYPERLKEYGSRVTPMDKLITPKEFVETVTDILSGGKGYAPRQ